MIISIRGTSGSGKTHLARRVMALVGGAPVLVRRLGKRLPVATQLPGLVVLGDYSAPQGGADTLRDSERDEVFAMMDEFSGQCDLLYEGMMIANEVTRTVELARRTPTHVFFLNTPLEDCLASINERRRARGKDEPVSLKKTTEKFAELERVRSRLRASGRLAGVHLLDREAAFTEVCRLLNLTVQGAAPGVQS